MSRGTAVVKLSDFGRVLCGTNWKIGLATRKEGKANVMEA
jgi:hypothetical protein